MGKLEGNSSINHFSHEHPLKLQYLQSPISSKPTCLACNASISDSFYTCVSCNFYLHKTCSNIPRTLKHHSDQKHDLILLSSPAYPEGVFKCNACGSHGNGFSYHCPDCQHDLHVVCASMPQSISHAAHGHTLGLCFRPPYDDHEFSCDICKQHGSNQWLYRCSLCEFDAHMKCVVARTTTSRAVLPKSTSLPHYKTTTQPPPPIQTYYTSPTQHHQVLRLPPPPPSTPIPPYYAQVAPPMGVSQYVQSPRQEGFINNMAGHAIEGFVGSVTQEIFQSVFQGMSS